MASTSGNIGSPHGDALEDVSANGTLYGLAGNDVMHGGPGDDRLYGGKGADTAVYGGRLDDYEILWDGKSTIVHDRRPGFDGTDRVFDTEWLQFGDQRVALEGHGKLRLADGGVVDLAPTPIPAAQTGFSRFDDFATDSGGDDVFEGLGGDDTLFGGKGSDTAILRGNIADYEFERTGSAVQVRDRVAGRDGNDRLIFVEKLQFADGLLSFDADGNLVGADGGVIVVARLHEPPPPPTIDPPPLSEGPDVYNLTPAERLRSGLWTPTPGDAEPFPMGVTVEPTEVMLVGLPSAAELIITVEP